MYTRYIVSKSVLDALYSVKKCLIDSLSVLFEVGVLGEQLVGALEDQNSTLRSRTGRVNLAKSVVLARARGRAHRYYGVLKFARTEDMLTLAVNVLAVNFWLLTVPFPST